VKQKKLFCNNTMLTEVVKIFGFQDRTPQEMEKFGYDTEIKRLYKRRNAANELVDAVEKEIHEIEKVIDDRKLRRDRVLKSIGVTSGIMGQCCNSSCCDDVDAEEVGRLSGKDAGQVMSRGRLKQRLEEVQLDLQERTQELNTLRHEGRQMASKVTAGPSLSGERQFLESNVKAAKERTKRHFAALFSGSVQQLTQMVFFSWSSFVKNGKMKDKAMKKGATSLAMLFKNGMLAICFNAWKDLSLSRKEKEGKKKERLMTHYAAKFSGGLAGASMQMCFRAWHKFVQENSQQNRILEAEQRAHRDVGDAMEARFAQLSMHMAQGHVVESKLVIKSGTGLGTAQHSVYCVCEIPGKPRAAFHTETIKTTGQFGGPGAPQQAEWNCSHSLLDFEAGDELNFKVMVKGGILHSDECLGIATLKPSQFFPDGFDGPLKLQLPAGTNKKPAAASSGEIRVQVRITMQKLPDRQAPIAPMSPTSETHDTARHAENAAQAAQQAQRAAADVQKAVDDFKLHQDRTQQQQGCLPSCFRGAPRERAGSPQGPHH